MGLLDNKRILVTGLATKRSIAYAVAREAQEAGAEVILTSFGRMLSITERAARTLPQPPPVLELDVSRPEDFPRLTAELEDRWGGIDGAVHAIAFAPADALGGEFMRTPPESAELAFRVSAFSLKALAEALTPLLERRGGGSIVGLDFDATGSWPHYDWMGVAKAALESVSRYLARYLGPSGVRVNLVAAGPVATTTAGAIPGFDAFIGYWGYKAPLGWDVHDPTPVARAVCMLLSDYAGAITGEIVHADGGYHALSAPLGDWFDQMAADLRAIGNGEAATPRSAADSSPADPR